MRPQVTRADHARLSDEELVHRYVQRQDRASVSTLFERYGHLVYGVCLNYFRSPGAAKQATEQVFMKLMEDLFKFKIEHFKPWLLHYVRNYCLSASGSISAKKTGTTDDLWADDDRGLKEKLDQGKLNDELSRAFEQLSKDERICIDLFYGQHLTYPEIVKKTKYSLKDINRALQNGKRRLRDKLLT